MKQDSRDICDICLLVSGWVRSKKDLGAVYSGWGIGSIGVAIILLLFLQVRQDSNVMPTQTLCEECCSPCHSLTWGGNCKWRAVDDDDHDDEEEEHT